MLALLLRRRLRAGYNTLRSFSPYIWGRNFVFASGGIGLLFGLYRGFARLLTYLITIPLIGPLLIWKLTAMLLLTTLSMVIISSLLTSLTTLYYSSDLRFLMKAPLSQRIIFADKSVESIFFASWMIGLVLLP